VCVCVCVRARARALEGVRTYYLQHVCDEFSVHSVCHELENKRNIRIQIGWR
jgi:hypothetical protein